jgi:chemotaxis signal transduction protein
VENAWGAAPSSGGGDRKGASADALREALRSLGGAGVAGMSAGSLSPEQLADLAQRAGLADAARAADLARLLGREPGGAAPAANLGPQYVIFAVGELECTVPAESVQGVERIVDVTSVPNTVPWVLGIVQFRGSIISVVDLRGFLELQPAGLTNRSRMVVVSAHGMTIGLQVDAVLEMRTDTADSRPAAGGSLPSWIAPYSAGTIELGGRRVTLIDVQRLLFADKMRRFQDDGT